MVRRGFVVAALVAVVLVPAAAASSAAQVELALVPLPKSALGSPARSLSVARDSGVVSNADAASQATGKVTPAQLKRLGRLSGYLLDYGNPFSSAAGVREIQTEVDRYRSVADARKALDFWRRDELDTTLLEKLGVDFSVKRLQPSGIPGPHWVYAGTASIQGLKPIHGVDAELQEGRYLLDVSVSAASTGAAARLVTTVARRLDQRMRLALVGRLHAKPVSLPGDLKPGPPARGPKPAALVLRPADIGPSVTVVHRGYSKPKSALDENALSVYDLTMTSQGAFPFVSQEVLVGGNPLEARYFAAIAANAVAASGGQALEVTQVDLSGVGDDAHGQILKVTLGGRTAYETLIVLTHGSYLDFLVAAKASAFVAADTHRLAMLAAKRLDAGF